MFRLIGLLSLLACVGCMAEPVPVVAPAPPQPEPKPKSNVVDITKLKFSAQDVQHRFTTFDATARRFAGKGFDYQPYQLGGNFVRAVWAKNTSFDAPIFLRPPRQALKSVHRISVDTIVLPFPQALCAALAVEYVDADPDKWSVSFSYREGPGGSVTGPGWSIRFLRWDPTELGRTSPFRPSDHARERVDLPVYGYGVRATGVSFSSNRPMQQNFSRYAASATAMRDAYLADLDSLEKKVVAFIEAHKGFKNIPVGPGRGGIPPKLRSEPLSAAEEKAELAKARAYFTSQRKLMQEKHQDMYRALRASFPLERCWPELAVKK